MKRIFCTFGLLAFITLLNAQIKVACIGNSITYGSGIEGRDSLSYPAQLQKMMGKQWDIENFGVSGATLLKKGNKPYWKETAFTAALSFRPEIVIIKLGTNDSKPFNWQYKNEYPVDYKALIDTFHNLETVKKIFICMPVPVVEDRWGISKTVTENEIVPMVKKIGEANNVEVIDLYTPFAGKDYLLPDKIHPNASGAALMASILHEYLNKYLDSKK